MDITVHEVAGGICRLSTFVPAANMPFNQYLILAEEPMLFHAGSHPGRSSGRSPILIRPPWR
jgi:hypothetical protein